MRDILGCTLREESGTLCTALSACSSLCQKGTSLRLEVPLNVIKLIILARTDGSHRTSLLIKGEGAEERTMRNMTIPKGIHGG